MLSRYEGEVFLWMLLVGLNVDDFAIQGEIKLVVQYKCKGASLGDEVW